MIGDSTCTGCLYPAVNGRLYSNIGVGLLLYLWNGYAKTLERDKADTIPTPFLCLITNVPQGIEGHRNSMRIKSLFLALSLLILGATTEVQARDKGYKGMFNAGWIFLSEDVSFEALTIHGYQFNPYLFVGGGAGVNYYSSGSDDAGFIPIFADIRGYLLKGGISPYAEAKIGGQVTYNGNGTSGLYFAPEIGCTFATSKRFAIDVAVEYILHRSQNIAPTQSGRVCNIDTGGLCLKIGVEF